MGFSTKPTQSEQLVAEGSSATKKPMASEDMVCRSLETPDLSHRMGACEVFLLPPRQGRLDSFRCQVCGILQYLNTVGKFPAPPCVVLVGCSGNESWHDPEKKNIQLVVFLNMRDKLVHSMTPISHPTGGFLHSGTKAWFILFHYLSQQQDTSKA